MDKNGFVPLADYSKSKLGDLYSTPAGDLSTFVNNIFTFAISIGAIFAVIQIVRGGYLYGMGDTLGAGSIQKAKDAWSNAVIGLLLLLSIYLILHTINPDLLNIKLPKLDTGAAPISNTSTPSPVKPPDIVPDIPKQTTTVQTGGVDDSGKAIVTQASPAGIDPSTGQEVFKDANGTCYEKKSPTDVTPRQISCPANTD